MKKFLDVPLIIGYVISISIGITLYLLSKATLESLAVGLLVSILTTLVRIRADIHKNQTEIIEAIGINKDINKDVNLRTALYKLANDYIAIASNPQEKQFVEEARIIVDNCVRATAELANGKFFVEEEDRRVGYIFSKVRETRASIKAITYLRKKGWWDSPIGKKYLEEQKEALSRGVEITRIFILPNQTDSDLRQPVKDQKEISVKIGERDIGIKIMMVREESVPADLRVNLLICDDNWVTTTRFDRYGGNDGGLVSKDETDVSPAIRKWNRLINHAREIVDIDKDID